MDGLTAQQKLLNTMLCCLGRYDPRFINLTGDALINTGFFKAFKELYVSLFAQEKKWS